MQDEADETPENELVDDVESARRVPPARQGSRDERRDATLRALAAGQDASCAYCGDPLPPLPPRGGRPTPYCAADPDRYGRWGAKVISCAMLDEHREIWVRVYGPDQPMTQVDVHVLDDRAAALLAALGPVRDEVAALRTRVTDDAAAALADKAAAEDAREHALEQARLAAAAQAEAQVAADDARRQADTDRAHLRTARAVEAQAVHDREQAELARRSAERDRDTADADRQRALEQLTIAQDHITDLQTTLAGERATALDNLDRLRREHDQAQRDLRTSLTDERDTLLRTRTEEFEQQVRALRVAAEQRSDELTRQFTQAAQDYASALGPLHEQISALRTQLAEQHDVSSALRRQHDQLHAAVNHALEQATEEDPLRHRVAAALQQVPTPPG